MHQRTSCINFDKLWKLLMISMEHDFPTKSFNISIIILILSYYYISIRLVIRKRFGGLNKKKTENY
jgi:hypothetical protein